MPDTQIPSIESLTGGIGLQDLLQIAGFAPTPEPKPAPLPPGCTRLFLNDEQRQTNLDNNLRAMPAQAVRTIRKIAATSPRTDITFVKTQEGAISAIVVEGASTRQLASLRKPREEAGALTVDIDPVGSGAVAVLGFAMGYHVEALARRYKKMGVLLAFEPDVSLLRAVLEHVDHSEWLSLRNCVIVTDPDDQGEITASITGAEGIFMLGTRFLDHPASKQRLGDLAERFSATLSGALRATRTSIVTTLVQVDKTVRNLLGNIEAYANAPGIAELAGAARDKPAIVVSAGPSLRRNIDLLRDPAVRSRFVVIAVQTVLKTLLSKGIRPDFVTALDHDSISKRFYEGLTSEQVEGVTLVVEPKASPAIFDAFPGFIRCPGERILDNILAEGADEATTQLLTRPRGELKPGATVAHLAYYLARHLGCDPVIFVGQDLGFTDGQYYAAGAAIHQVWSGELNEFNTLEMLEWQRIVRQRSILHKMKDHLGRDCYSDEQMTTYLVQFERDFGEDVARGLRVVDATEGGVAKRHASSLTLQQAIERYAASAPIALPSATSDSPTPRRRDALYRRLRQVRADVWRVGEISRTTAKAVQEILENQEDQARVNRLISRIESHAKEVQQIVPGYPLVQHLNQTGILNRFKADRAIELDSDQSPLERQRRQAERDLKNVTWLADASDELGSMFDGAIATIKSGRRSGAESGMGAATGETKRLQAAVASITTSAPRDNVRAFIHVDAEMSSLGHARDLSKPVVGSLNALQMTLTRLSRAKKLKGVTLLTSQPDRVRSLLAHCAAQFGSLDIQLVVLPAHSGDARRRSIAAARAWSQPCWRGGIANISIFDEVFTPTAIRAAFESGVSADGVLLVGPDWCFIDPAHIDQLIERFTSATEQQRIVFSPAVPGLGACILEKPLALEFSNQLQANGPLGSIGTILGYLPIAPQVDQIAKPSCVTVDPTVRDAHLRLIADRSDRTHLLASIARRLGDRWLAASADEIASIAREIASGSEILADAVHVQLTAQRSGSSISQPLDLELLRLRLMPLRLAERGLAVTFDGGDPLLHPRFEHAVAMARDLGALAVDVRTEMLAPTDLERLLQVRPDVVSVDMHADRPETYARVRGIDALPQVRDRVVKLIESRRTLDEGLVNQWIVPRITRRDEVYSEIESFYDRWIMAAGAAVIDSLASPIAGHRIDPLPLPVQAAQRLAGSIIRIRADGCVEGIAPHNLESAA
ncbi:MAG: 6-hydroxymethylpterin diphosphokinase MptE-like protein [Phycisphaerales bacterium]